MSYTRTRIILTGTLTIGIVLLSLSACAADGKGGYAGSFWQVPLGARPAAMGGAYTAIADDGAGVFYNPAGCSTLKQSLFSASYRVMQLDRTLGYAHALFPVRNEAVLGVGWLYASSGKVEARDNDGDPLGYSIGMVNHDFFATFAKRFERYFSMGIRMSYLYSRFAEMSSSSVGFDLGSMVYLSQLIDREKRETMAVQDIQAGIVIRHIEASYRWNNQKYLLKYVGDEIYNDQEDKVPLEGAVGMSARFLQRKLLLATDFVVREHLGPSFHGGGEYYVVPQFALRAGYSDHSFTAGTGYIFKLKERNFAIDYAFSTGKVDEGSEHLFSVDFQF